MNLASVQENGAEGKGAQRKNPGVGTLLYMSGEYDGRRSLEEAQQVL
jgi:hypothetical protein